MPDHRSLRWAFLLSLAWGCLAELPEADPGPDGGPPAPSFRFEAWPADGTWGVPPSLPLAAVRWVGDPAAGTSVRLEGPAGPVPAAARAADCHGLGFDTGTCIAIEPSEPLEPWAPHRMVLADGEGAVLWGSRFATGPAGPTDPPVWLPLACALDESPMAAGCVLAGEDGVTLRVRASGPLRLWLEGGGAADRAVAPRGEAILRLRGLPPDRPVGAELRTRDLSDRAARLELDLHTAPTLPPVSITEVRADALGPEPGQEYVEVVNSGAVTLDLQGYSLADAPDSDGDVVASRAPLPPGGRALLVADDFDGAHPDDPPVPPGVLLVRMGSSLGSGGLSNSGEPLFLRDPRGYRVSAAPALAPPSAGTCLVRTSPDGRAGDVDAFAFDPTGGCTPGTPDRVP